MQYIRKHIFSFKLWFANHLTYIYLNQQSKKKDFKKKNLYYMGFGELNPTESFGNPHPGSGSLVNRSFQVKKQPSHITIFK